MQTRAFCRELVVSALMQEPKVSLLSPGLLLRFPTRGITLPQVVEGKQRAYEL
jgi:hypothetical protein